MKTASNVRSRQNNASQSRGFPRSILNRDFSPIFHAHYGSGEIGERAVESFI